MENNTRADKRSKAVVAQLNAELGASSFNKKTLANALGIDYSAMRNYLDGIRPLPLAVLYNALDVMDVDPVAFTRRAMERAGL